MNNPVKDKLGHSGSSDGADERTANIPLIDISGPDADQKEIAQQLVDAAGKRCAPARVHADGQIASRRVQRPADR